MSVDFQESSIGARPSETLLEQSIKGSRKFSNYVVSSMLTIGGVGFLLASTSSYIGKDLLPLGRPSTLIFIPQGLLMGFYGITASLLAIYLWSLVSVDFGSGSNTFDKDRGLLFVSRRAYLKEIMIEIPLKDIQAVKLDIRDGFNARRRICLRIKGRKDIPITGTGSPQPLFDLEQDAAQLARFLEVNLENSATVVPSGL